MRKFFRNENGTGAIELAFIAPFLALVLLGTISGWSYYQQNNYMRDSVDVAGKYFLQGGTSDTVGLSIAKAAWTGKPADGKISLTRTCTCAGAAASCTGACSSGNPPRTYLTIEATANWKEALFVDPIFPNGIQLYEREVVRVR